MNAADPAAHVRAAAALDGNGPGRRRWTSSARRRGLVAFFNASMHTSLHPPGIRSDQSGRVSERNVLHVHLLRPRTPDPVKRDLAWASQPPSITAMNKAGAGLLGFSDEAALQPQPSSAEDRSSGFPIGNIPGARPRPRATRRGTARARTWGWGGGGGVAVGTQRARERKRPESGASTQTSRFESEPHCVAVPIKSERLRRSSDLPFLPSSNPTTKGLKNTLTDLVVSPNQAGLAHAPRGDHDRLLPLHACAITRGRGPFFAA